MSMNVDFLYDRGSLALRVPDGAEVYASDYPAPGAPDAELVLDALARPAGCAPLAGALAARRPGDVVVVVSDVTRPVPYARFLPGLLGVIEGAGVARDEIVILVATGMHRPSTPAEREEMFGREVVGRYRIVDHCADRDDDLVTLERPSWSGARVRVNRLFVEAGFRITTGLVEPHFMVGFSGGRKTVCPGLVALETIRRFHGAEFLAHPRAWGGVLEGNPCHQESLSVARMAGVDFTLGVVVNRDRRTVRAFAGELETAHDEACRFVARCACREVAHEADVVITSSGGYPLDATFYQSVKGFVSCLPAVRPGGKVVAFAKCGQGTGSSEYAGIMQSYRGRWREFLQEIRQPGFFIRDQWELQMHARALERVGEENLHFVSEGYRQEDLDGLSVTGAAAAPGEARSVIQEVVDRAVAGAARVAVFPEGPYCVPVAPLR